MRGAVISTSFDPGVDVLLFWLLLLLLDDVLRIFTCIFSSSKSPNIPKARQRLWTCCAMRLREIRKGYIRHLQYALRRHGGVQAGGGAKERARFDDGECSGPKRHTTRGTDGGKLRRALLRSRPASTATASRELVKGEGEEEDKS